jgi:8-oxo-dGTP pyrophosphatase MutT (NUDIX family)
VDLLASVEPWTVVGPGRVVFEHPLAESIVEEPVRLPDGSTLPWLRGADARDGAASRDCATAVCLLEGCVVVAAQWCVGPGRAVLELPGGGLEAGEAPEEGARRECREEVGVLPERLTHVGSYLLNNRRSGRRMHVFVGTGCRRVAASPEAGEVISVGLVTVAQLDEAIGAGQVENATVLAAWLLARETVLASQFG